YSDVEHAVRPVTSGHRLVLTFNLIQVASGPPQAASSLNDDQARLVRSLALWIDRLRGDSESAPNFLAYMLDHKYTDANMRSDHLKGKDANKTYDPYDHYGGRRGYNWKSDDDDDDGSAESDEGSGYGSVIDEYHELAEVFDKSLSLRTFYRAHGQLLARDINIEEANLVQDDPFDRAPDKEDYEGYTGNAGASATHFYRNSCIVIMPRQNAAPFLLEHARNGFVGLDDWLGPMIMALKDNPGDEHRKAELIRICQLFLEAYYDSTNERSVMSRYNRSSGSFSDHSLGVIARAALQLRNQGLFNQTYNASKDGLPIEVYSAFGGTVNNAEMG
ncbi:MAG: hypothetical protein Q9226_003677, partial [Calogaya cf. arnoldii]